ncbi:MAG: DNA repair exonuclease [Candidatus Woesearchaeota archaeon]
MKFAHMADCHIGSWRDPKLRQISIDAFIKAIDMVIELNVDFLLVSGDLFNTSMPGVDILKAVVIKLKQLKDRFIPVYITAGSHDFSPSGKTILDVLEHAGLLINVVKGSVEDEKLRLVFTIDQKTGAKITGMLGKKGMLEKHFYEALDKESLENQEGFKIFMFHTALTEFKSKELEKMDSAPLSLLPKNFDYYAGGHVHEIIEKEEPDYKKIIYPGPLFPNNFAEIEKLGRGGFYVYEDNKTEYYPVQICNTFSVKINVENKPPEAVRQEILDRIDNQEFINTIVTLRVSGILSSGKPSDIDFGKIFKLIYDKGAVFVMKNTSKLQSKDFEEIKIDSGSVEDIEDSLIREHVSQIKMENLTPEKEILLTKQLINTLNIERDEGERVSDFEKKIKDNVNTILEMEKN